MKALLLAITILIAVPAIGQEVQHAPTVAQCQSGSKIVVVEAGSRPRLRRCDRYNFDELATGNARLQSC